MSEIEAWLRNRLELEELDLQADEDRDPFLVKEVKGLYEQQG